MTSHRASRVLMPTSNCLVVCFVFVAAACFNLMGGRDFITNYVPSTTARDHSVEVWTSPHVVDCSIIAKRWRRPDGAVFKRTSTEPPFTMSIHNPDTDEVSNHIFQHGCWECPHIRDVLKALAFYPDSYFLDIGGNIGMWTLAAAAANHQTFTIEALRTNVKRICQTVEKNSFHDRTHVMNVAATSAPETFRLKVPKGNVGGTRVVPLGNETRSGKDIVKGVPIDSLNLPNDRPVVMKLDVEGHELQALLGMSKFLNASNIVYAMTELRSELYNDARWGDIFKVLTSKGLKPYRINDEDETMLDVRFWWKWQHFKHPNVLYYDVVWRRDDFVPSSQIQ